MPVSKKFFQHDCNSCVFLGHFSWDETSYDLYYCEKSFHTVIARYGNDGADYCSGWDSRLPVLQEAQKRAERYLKIISQ